MKKIILTIFVLAAAAGWTAASEQGSFKAGVMAGYPTALTLGYHVSEKAEINALAGLGFGYGGWYSAIGGIVGANVLFDLAVLDINGHLFPLTLGPQVNVIFGNSYLGIDGLLDLRMEHSFKNAPQWNVFAEIGAGIHWYKYKYTWLGIAYDDFSGIEFQLSGGVGARYVF